MGDKRHTQWEDNPEYVGTEGGGYYQITKEVLIIRTRTKELQNSRRHSW